MYGIKDAGLEWSEKLKKGLEDRNFVQSQVDTCLWYKEEMLLQFYINDCLMFSPYKYKIYELYLSSSIFQDRKW